MATIRSREISIRLSELSMSDYETTTSFCILRYYIPYLGNIITVVLIVTAKKLMCHSCWTHSCFFIPSITWLLLIAHYKKPCYWHVCKPICSPLKTNVQEMSQWGKIMFIQSLGPWDIGSGSIILYQKTIMGESRVQKEKKKPKVFIGKELLWSKENEGCVFAEDLHHPEVCIPTLPSLAIR